MRHILITLSLLAVATTLVGCETWSTDSEYGHAVFSDDGAGVAAVFMTYDAKDKVTHTAKKNFATQLLMKETTSSVKPSELTDLMPGRVVDLFYMRSEGYLILGRQTDEVERPDGSLESDIYYDHVTMDGTITSLGGGTFLTMLSCDGGTSRSAVSRPIRVIPSPDGSVLARFNAETSCDARTQTVTFLDAQDLSVIDGPYTVPDVAQVQSGIGAMWATLDIGWTAGGKFAAAYWGSGDTFASLKGVLYKAGLAPQQNVTMSTGCFYPPTTSSEVRSDGSAVSIDEATGAVLLSSGANAPGAQGVFGCN
ncbi:MAG: hypothetical protein ACPGU1_21950 [Myxococcota bacterium]